MNAEDQQPNRQTLPESLAAGGYASVLDACCGPKMFWFDQEDERVIFADKRRETHTVPDSSSQGGSRTIAINPDVLADFTALPLKLCHVINWSWWWVLSPIWITASIVVLILAIAALGYWLTRPKTPAEKAAAACRAMSEALRNRR